MSNLSISESIREDVELLADSLRETDVEEISLFGYKTPREALIDGLLGENCYTLFYKYKPIAMFGSRATNIKGVGSVWLLGTNEIESRAKLFILATPRLWELCFNGFDSLYNIVPISNTKTIKWLLKFGATFDNTPVVIKDTTMVVFRKEKQ